MVSVQKPLRRPSKEGFLPFKTSERFSVHRIQLVLKHVADSENSLYRRQGKCTMCGAAV
jgi:hypothetical protein